MQAKVKVLPVGRERKNQAIVALAVRTAPSAVTRSVFVSVANLDLERAARRLEVCGDGGLIEVRDLQLDPQARSDVVLDDIPRDVGPSRSDSPAPMPAATAPPTSSRSTTTPGPSSRPIVPARSWSSGPGDPYLETALSYLPNVRAVRRDAGRVPGQGRAAGRDAAGT